MVIKKSLNILSARKKAAEDAKLSAMYIHFLSKYANDFIILLDENMNFIEVNDRVIDFYGYTREELIGMHASRLRAPQTKESFEEQVGIARKSGSALYETLHKRKDGTVFPVEINLRTIETPDKKYYQAVIRDITERKEAEKALQKRESDYRELVESVNSIILRWTHEGRITFLNDFGQRFFGYSADEIIGRHVIGTIVPVKDTEGRDMRRFMDDICANPASFEKNVNENIRSNGERVWIAWTNRIVKDEQGRVAEIMSVGTDITESKRAEEAVRELNVKLEQRVAERTVELLVEKDRAEAADRLKSSFLATMSHELRTPLNSIIGFTGVILQELSGPLNPEQRKQLGMVQASGRHLLSLINDVLDISKIEAGELKVSKEKFNLRPSILSAAGIVKPLAEKKAIDLRVDVAEDVGELISDPRRVEQILLNLLNNAVKFTEQGEVTLKAKIVPGPQHSSAVISVSDTGIGIKPEDMEKLFRPFFQIDSGLTRHHEGTGLGLAICRRLVDLLGGEISVTSDWGRGSVFTLTLPLKENMLQDIKGPQTI